MSKTSRWADDERGHEKLIVIENELPENTPPIDEYVETETEKE